MFQSPGFQVAEGFQRIFNEPDRDKAVSAIRYMAQCIGANPEVAINDAIPLQYVERAVQV
jgi:hypothetical protein